MAKVIFEGSAKPDNPMFKEPTYFATPFLLKYLDRKKQESNKAGNRPIAVAQELKEKTK